MLTYSPNSAVFPTRFTRVGAVPICFSSPAEIVDAGGEPIRLSVRNVFSQYQNDGDICDYELRNQSDGGGFWLNGNTLAALQSDAIWMDDDSFIPPLTFPSFAQLSQWRETLSEKLESSASV